MLNDESQGFTLTPKDEDTKLYLKLRQGQTLWNVSFGAQRPH